jgi:DNA-directed RNA polymerase specialized sigma24 family protein
MAAEHIGQLASERVGIRDDLAPILDDLYDLPPWWMGAAVVPNDWPEGDTRWELVEALSANDTARIALEALARAVEDDRKEILRKYAESIPRPQIAQAMGMTLGQLREWMGWP